MRMKKLLSALCTLVLTTWPLSSALAAADGALTGHFTINEKGDYVVFSQGNLQYQASTGTWQFAAEQYTVLGEAAGNATATGRDTQEKWIDLFGWGTGDAPYKASASNGDYAVFTDWGTNAISNGGSTAGIWRTLTQDEWTYLLTQRTNASGLRGQASVNGVKGYLLLPDGFVLPDGCVFYSNPGSWTANTYTLEQWSAMQTAGAVFLPCGGFRDGDEVNMEDTGSPIGSYWSATADGASEAYGFYVGADGAEMTTNSLYYGRSVRLVNVQSVPTSIGDIQSSHIPCIKVLHNGKILINQNGEMYDVSGKKVSAQ